jgi:hypothetical protein
MGAGKENSNTRGPNKKRGMFMRLFDWVAQGAEKAQKRAGQCPA